MTGHVCAGPVTHAPFAAGDVESTIPGRFAAQVRAHPQCVAVRDGGRSLTYAELDAWSNGVAVDLVERLGPRTEPVPLVLHQGAASVAATLGTLKAGKAYVPLDPAEPAHRLAATIERVGGRVVVTDRESVATCTELGPEPLLVDGRAAGRAPRATIGTGALAYVYFTSGTTGRPKGVLDSHRNVLHNVMRYTNALSVAPADRLTLLQAPSFSGAVSSLFAGVLNGATVCTFRPREKGPDGLYAWLRDECVTIYHSVPALFRSFLSGDRDLPDIRVVRLEGDRATSLDLDLFDRHCPRTAILAIGLGTTETGLACQLLRRHGEAVGPIVPVGYALPGMSISVVDETGDAVADGDVGELAITSRYLALGYWNDPELTASAFRAAPAGSEPRTYRTGDLGRLRHDGCVEYRGRVDDQLKVLGHRIDPVEVEDELVRLDTVREALATTFPGRRGEGRLVAFLVPEQGREPDEALIRSELSRRLPSHLVPSAFVVLEALPLGANGKVDRGALAAPTRVAAPSPPTDELEARIAAIWAAVLETPVGAEDDFFALGGDSLSAAEIAAAIEVETGIPVPLGALVAAPTVRALCRALAGLADERAGSRVVVLADGASDPPLTLLHGLTGHTLIYAELARALAPERAVWGIEPGIPLEGASVEQLAAAHAAVLRETQHEGPFVVGGYCAGGAVAFEVARQLAAAGADVALVVLLGIGPRDLPTLLSPDALQRWSRATLGFGATVRRHWHAGQSSPIHARVAFVARRAGGRLRRMLRFGDHLPPSPERPGLADALAAYRPEPLAGPVLVILESEPTAVYSREPAAEWRRLTTGSLAVHVLPGPFHALIDDPSTAARCAELILRQAALAVAPGAKGWIDAQMVP